MPGHNDTWWWLIEFFTAYIFVACIGACLLGRHLNEEVILDLANNTVIATVQVLVEVSKNAPLWRDPLRIAAWPSPKRNRRSRRYYERQRNARNGTGRVNCDNGWTRLATDRRQSRFWTDLASDETTNDVGEYETKLSKEKCASCWLNALPFKNIAST